MKKRYHINKNTFFITTGLCALVVIPEISFAATLTFKDLAVFIVDGIFNQLIIVIIGFAMIYFLWGVAKYILHADDAKAREGGRSMMIHGIIALFVMVSVWGFITLLRDTFRLDERASPNARDFLG